MEAGPSNKIFRIRAINLEGENNPCTLHPIWPVFESKTHSSFVASFKTGSGERNEMGGTTSVVMTADVIIIIALVPWSFGS